MLFLPLFPAMALPRLNLGRTTACPGEIPDFETRLQQVLPIARRGTVQDTLESVPVSHLAVPDGSSIPR